MRKFKRLLATISVMLCMSMFLGMGSVFASEEENSYRDELKQYQDIIDIINLEYGSSISIPENTLKEVYGNINDLSLDEFESKLRSDYEDFNSGIEGAPNPVSVVSEDIPPIGARAYITKRLYSLWGDSSTPYYGKVYVDVGMESFPTPVFVKVMQTGSINYTDKTHFRLSNSQYSFGSSNKSIEVIYKGMYYTAEGIALTGVKTFYITYFADYEI